MHCIINKNSIFLVLIKIKKYWMLFCFIKFLHTSSYVWREKQENIIFISIKIPLLYSIWFLCNPLDYSIVHYAPKTRTIRHCI